MISSSPLERLNGAEFQTAFHWHLADRGIRHIYIKPATPRLNSKVERSHRIDAEEFCRMLDGVVIDDTQLSTKSSPSGKPSATAIGRTAASAARRPTSGCGGRRRPS